MRHTVDAVAHITDDVELFVEFAAQRLAVSLRGKRLATGKLPMPGKMRSVRAKGEKKPAISLDDSRDDNHCLVGGHTASQGADPGIITISIVSAWRVPIKWLQLQCEAQRHATGIEADFVVACLILERAGDVTDVRPASIFCDSGVASIVTSGVRRNG